MMEETRKENVLVERTANIERKGRADYGTMFVDGHGTRVECEEVALMGVGETEEVKSMGVRVKVALEVVLVVGERSSGVNQCGQYVRARTVACGDEGWRCNSLQGRYLKTGVGVEVWQIQLYRTGALFYTQKKSA